MTTRLAQILAGLLLCLTTAAARSQSKYTFQPPQTVIAHNIYDLHLLLVGICAVIFVVCVRPHVLRDSEAPPISGPPG